MTGIERLRRLSRIWPCDCKVLVEQEKLESIADQIEREQDATVADSPYDALPPDERDAIAWVREHGGIKSVKEEWNHSRNLKRSLETARKKVERQQRHIEFVQRKCRERQEHICELNKLKRAYVDALNGVCKRLGLTNGTGLPDMSEVIWTELDRRLMPEGMEWLLDAWPRFEDDEPVRVGDEYECWCGETHKTNSITIREGSSMINATNAHSFVVSDGPTTAHGERVKRPAPKVLDADGVEIRVGDKVWSTTGEFDGKRTVKSVHVDDGELPYALFDEHSEPWSCLCCYLTHRAPVLAADGKPLREGETVWDIDGGGPYEVEGFVGKPLCVMLRSGVNHEMPRYPSKLTHERPVADSWERLEEDARNIRMAMLDSDEMPFEVIDERALDIVRRAMALAERDAK